MTHLTLINRTVKSSSRTAALLKIGEKRITPRVRGLNRIKALRVNEQRRQIDYRLYQINSSSKGKGNYIAPRGLEIIERVLVVLFALFIVRTELPARR